MEGESTHRKEWETYGIVWCYVCVRKKYVNMQIRCKKIGENMNRERIEETGRNKNNEN